MSQGPEIQVPLATLRETEDTLSGVCTIISFVFAKLIIETDITIYQNMYCNFDYP